MALSFDSLPGSLKKSKPNLTLASERTQARSCPSPAPSFPTTQGPARTCVYYCLLYVSGCLLLSVRLRAPLELPHVQDPGGEAVTEGGLAQVCCYVFDEIVDCFMFDSWFILFRPPGASCGATGHAWGAQWGLAGRVASKVVRGVAGNMSEVSNGLPRMCRTRSKLQTAVQAQTGGACGARWVRRGLRRRWAHWGAQDVRAQ